MTQKVQSVKFWCFLQIWKIFFAYVLYYVEN